MKAIDIPSGFPVTFASGASSTYKRAIPQTTIDPNAASLVNGYPPNTFTPIGAGGSPPDGRDMNGILNQITAWNQWQQLGGAVPWDSSFSAAIGGYPKGATVAAATFGYFWISSADDNVADPDTGGAGWVKFHPSFLYSFDSASPPGSPVALLPGDLCTVSFSAQTSIPFNVALSEGIYALDLAVLANTSTNSDCYLNPNGASVTNGFKVWATRAADNGAVAPPWLATNPYLGGASYDGFFFDLFQNVVVGDTINDIGPFFISMIISTKTTAKFIKFDSSIAGGATSGHALWNDTTTPWTSLGTFFTQFGSGGGNAQLTGTALIRRLS